MGWERRPNTSWWQLLQFQNWPGRRRSSKTLENYIKKKKTCLYWSWVKIHRQWRRTKKKM